MRHQSCSSTLVTWTAEEIAALKAAVASGVLSVSYAGPPARTITYQSLESMRDLLASMEATATAEAGGTRYRRVVVNRGFRSGCGPSWRRNE